MEFKKSNSTFITLDGKAFQNDADAIKAYCELIEVYQLYSKKAIYRNEAEKQALAIQYWEKFKSDAIKSGIPNWLKEVIQTPIKKKADQKSRGMSLSKKNFSNTIIILKSEGWKHNLQTFEHVPENLKGKKIPQVARYDGKNKDVVEIIGETDLKPGEVKQIITQRKVMHLHTFEKEDNWFAFYFTFSDLKGDHWDNTNHIHFISGQWNIKLADLIKRAQEKWHSVNGIHIKWTG